jgi:hypothetical protein
MRSLIIISIAALLFLPAMIVWLFVLLRNGLKWISVNHTKASTATQDVAKGALVVSKVAMFWSWLVAPKGLLAVLASIGVVSTPWVVVVAPIVMAVSGAIFALAAALDLYSKWRTRCARRNRELEK